MTELKYNNLETATQVGPENFENVSLVHVLVTTISMASIIVVLSLAITAISSKSKCFVYLSNSEVIEIMSNIYIQEPPALGKVIPYLLLS